MSALRRSTYPDLSAEPTFYRPTLVSTLGALSAVESRAGAEIDALARWAPHKRKLDLPRIYEWGVLSGRVDLTLLDFLLVDTSTITTTSEIGLQPAGNGTSLSQSATLNASPYISWNPEGEPPTEAFYIAPPSRPLFFEAKLDLSNLPRHEPTAVIEDFPNDD